MKQITLGTTGITVPQNAFGALPIQRVSADEAVRLLRRAREGGMRFFDTARAYTDSEEKLGLAFGGHWDGLYVATKTAAKTPEALRADLEIVERKNHSLYVSYVPLGQDATVAYGAVDYRFKNNTNYPIKVVAYTKGSSLTVSLLGTQTQNKKVEIVTQTLSYDPFQVIYQEDSSLAPGTTQVKNGGYPGYKTVSYRVVYIDGKEVSRTLENNSSYKRVDKVILQGPAPAP